MSDTKTMTTAAGCPCGQPNHHRRPRGPVLMQDVHLFEKMAHFNRERLPERVVHVKADPTYGDAVAKGLEADLAQTAPDRDGLASGPSALSWTATLNTIN